MGKFRVKFKLQGLELEIEGSRDDVPLIADSLSRQVAGMLGPAGNIVDGEIIHDETDHSKAPIAQEISAPKKKPASRRRPPVVASDGKPSSGAAVDFKNDPSKWGTPQQGWSGAAKSIWLLYVVGKETSLSELSATQIANTFNKHFRQAGVIHNANVARDLGKLKVKSPSKVGENTLVAPSTWFLTHEGQKEAEALVAKALSPSVTPAT